MTLFLGVDIGGTVVKAALFDQTGREVSARSSPLINAHPAPGRTERDPVAMWATAATAIRAVLEAPGVAREQVAAVCCTGHGNGVYVFDGSMTPSYPGIVSSDTRTDALAREIMESDEDGQLCAWSEQKIRGSSTSVLLRWFDLNEPNVTAATRHVLLCKDYVRYRLTGVVDSDINDLSGSQLVHVRTADYDDRLFAALDIGHWRNRMPMIRRNTDVSGTVTRAAAEATGLMHGTPVVTGMMDVAAVTLASGVHSHDEISICAGTWNISVMLTQDSSGPPWPLMRALDRDGATTFICEGSPTSATNLAWLKNRVLPSDLDFDAINALVAGLPPDQSLLVYLPFIHGDVGAPRASFVGLGTESTTADLLRAVFEGVVFQNERHIRDLADVAGRRPRLARLSGGAASSDVWAQMFADVLDMPVEIAAGSELGALGCAICAAVAVGEHPDFESAIGAMTRIGRRFEPRAEQTGVYSVKRANWEMIEDTLGGAWKRLRKD